MFERKLTKQDMAYRLKITPHGFDYMIANRSMKVDILEKISEILNVPVSYWFDESTKIDLVEPKSTETGKEIFLTLNDQIKVKDEQIRFLQEMIRRQKD